MPSTPINTIQRRLRTITLLIPILTVGLLTRLFYWQIIRGPELQTQADRQHQTTTLLQARRGDILDDENNVLAGTKTLYELYVYKPQLKISNPELVEDLTPLITLDTEGTQSASVHDYLMQRLSLDSNWISLKHYITPDVKAKIEAMKIMGLGFNDEFVRFYPEASMAAQVLGFVGQDAAGEDQGYFGLEGYFDRLLRGRSGKVITERDAKGNPILIGDYQFLHSVEGKSVTTTIDEKTQYLVENALLQGLKTYEASAGSVIVMDSKTGRIRAMAAFPSYDPANYSKYDQGNYKNPNVADLFEPGSIFKPLIMAAGINEGVVGPDTVCDICAGPVIVGKYSIKTWNNVYYPNSTMTDVIVHSDNTGMSFVGFKLGKEKFAKYLKMLGFGQKTGIELQEEVSGQIRTADQFGDIDLATESFGQGIAVTPIQMITALNSLANGGVMVKPTLIESSDPPREKRIFSEKTASQMTSIMIQAVDEGEAKWARPKNMVIAGKTGTAQVPIEGHYDPKKTIASFIGFFPAYDPKYTMLVTLKEPQLSPWGSETAAPLWFTIAKRLLL